jgi:integrase
MTQIEASALTRQTVGDKRRHLDSFLDWVGKETPAKSVTQRKAAAYFDEALLPREVSLQTKRVALGVVHQFFDWMLPRGVVTLNPFDRIGKLQLKESKRGRAPKRRVWTPEDLEALLAVIPEDDPLWAFTALVAYTGRRREDICALRVVDASETFFRIQDAKSAAGVRRIPVHEVIQPLVKRLIATSKDGFLLPGLLTSGADNKRGILIGKRFLYAMRKRAKLTDPKLVEHAFRHTVLTQLENAAVSLYLRGELVGHEHGSVTERHYTLAAADKRLSDAIAHVTYGTKVDTLVRQQGEKVTVATLAKRRK